MDRKDLLTLSIGENIDRLVTLDMRGYGVPRILYEGARSRSGGPVCMNTAKKLSELLREGDYVFFMTGFVFEPHGKGELDGLTGTVMLIRALLKMHDIKPVVFCEELIAPAVKEVLQSAGVNAYSSIAELSNYPHAAAVIGISTDEKKAEKQWRDALAQQEPKAVFSIEKPGRNSRGIYHQGNGIDVSYLCAKIDGLFVACQEKGIPSFAIGDLGNEIGLAAIEDTIRSYIPLGDRCVCGCGDSLCVETKADYLTVATTSDWACYGVAAALAGLSGNIDLIPTAELEKKVCECANRNNLIDGSGWVIPSIDGIALDFNMMLVEVLRSVVSYPLSSCEPYGKMYDIVNSKKYFKE